MTTEGQPVLGTPCSRHASQGFIYSVIGCPRCYPTTEGQPVTEHRLNFATASVATGQPLLWCSCGAWQWTSKDGEVPLDHFAAGLAQGRAEGLDAVRTAIVGRLEHGLRHIPGATKSEERHFNDGQGFGLRYALERIDAALAETPVEAGLDVERIREDEATWGLRCTGCGTVHSGGSGHRPGDAGDRPCCPDCEHVSYFLAPTPPNCPHLTQPVVEHGRKVCPTCGTPWAQAKRETPAHRATSDGRVCARCVKPWPCPDAPPTEEPK